MIIMTRGDPLMDTFDSFQFNESIGSSSGTVYRLCLVEEEDT